MTLFQPNSAFEPLLRVDRLSLALGSGPSRTPLLDEVSFDIQSGEVLAVMGESGAGKSMTALAIMGILSPGIRITNGRISYRGEDLLNLSPDRRRGLRGPEMAMVHQDAPTALNPVYSVGWQIAEVFKVHKGMSSADAWRNAVALMMRVGLPNAAARAKDYPHQLSGGMRQRVMIAMAIALEPRLLIADEPTTALDVTVQSQIMQLLVALQEEKRMGMMLVTHDFGVVAENADRVVILYAGRVVESGTPQSILSAAAHPYSRALAACVPRMDEAAQRLPVIPGKPASLADATAGCAFAPRCPLRQQICLHERPPLREVAPGKMAACHFSEEVLADGSRAVVFKP
ncbi:ABC transporter ATP-binding protein [Aminobacter sp. Piv2-1]|uniref:ABC transporter ATP-binding protein n=1 Tax=Aminobacter sp. Piv2-1 TaxID=3031122 RepID=UPI0030AFBED8